MYTEDQLTELKNNLLAAAPKLVAKDAKFANDLAQFYGQKGYWSSAQLYWVNTLIKRAEKGGSTGVGGPILAQALAEKATAEHVTPTNVGDFKGVIALFEKAKQHLKYPKINLTCNGQKVILSLAGPKSKTPGYVVISGEGTYPNKKFYGKVSPEGQWLPSYMHKLDDLESLLNALANDPVSVAKEHGKLSGNCMFCNSPLTDPKSVAAGYGPICATHYGLKTQWEMAVYEFGGGKSKLIKSKPLLLGKVLTHINADIFDNSPENLQVVDPKEHWQVEVVKEEPKEVPIYSIWQ